MLFQTASFAIFFALLLVLLRFSSRRAELSLLFGASLLFYTLWVPVYVLLLVLSIGANYALLVAIERWRPRRLPIFASIAASLGLLAWFKYLAFLVESALPLLAGAGLEMPVPDVLLPLGISFYTFQILSLAIDVHRGNASRPPFLRYATYICFFPQLVAGPIVRGNELLPQLERGRRVERERTRRGVWLFASGLLKKVVIADFLLAPLVDDVFAEPANFGAAYAWTALYAFAFQIYYDFSGYTDMARGLGCILGFELPMNFQEPYLSRNPAEFWRRWHMTLSRWLRDYLYIPLGGNRRGEARRSLNLMLTMLLGGLWHGAGWHFVVWGALHGAYLAVHRTFCGRPADESEPISWRRDSWKIALLFHFVCFAWIFFRAPTFEAGTAFLQAMLGQLQTSVSDPQPLPVFGAIMVLGCVLLHFAERAWRVRLPALQRAATQGARGPVFEGLVLGVIAAVVVLCSGTGAEFIYFQF